MENTKLPIDKKTIVAKMKAHRLTYEKIQELSNGEITVHSLKNFMNAGKKAEEHTLAILAGMLECDVNDLVDKGYLLSENVPFEVNKLIGRLYTQNKNDIMVFYKSQLKILKTDQRFVSMITVASNLFYNFAKVDVNFDKGVIQKAIGIMQSELKTKETCCNSGLLDIQQKEKLDYFRKAVLELKENTPYSPNQVMLVFTFVFIIFDAIFLEECVASIIQLVPRRYCDKAEQYLNLSYRSEKMRNTLLDRFYAENNTALIFEEEEDDNFHPKSDAQILLLGQDDVLIEGIILMLAACARCRSHIDGNNTYSEYVDRPTFSAILQSLENIFDELEIELPIDNLGDMLKTRFNSRYIALKMAFNKLCPQNRPLSKLAFGFLLGKNS
jgi:hypothetical protein